MSTTLNAADLAHHLPHVTINYLAPDQNNAGQFIETGVFNYSALANAPYQRGLAAAPLSTFVKFQI